MSTDEKRKQFLATLNEVFCEVFEDDDIVITEDTMADDIEEWDSLMHITLVLAVESEFNMKLKAAEVGKLDNVGALLDIMVDRADV